MFINQLIIKRIIILTKTFYLFHQRHIVYPMKKIVLTALAVLSMSATYAQEVEGVTHSGRPTGQKPFPVETYIELANPVQTDLRLWKQVKGTLVSWGTTDKRYKKEEPAMQKMQRSQSLSAWKGERVSAQFAVWGDEDLDKLSFEVSELVNTSAKKRIDKSNILKGFVRYVMTDELNKDGRGGCGSRPNSLDFDSTLVADPIDHLAQTLEVKAHTTQGCWVRVQVPRDAAAGVYQGTVTVKNDSKVLGKLALQVRVGSRALPEVKDWAFHLDLWQNPYAVARYYQVEPWSDEHMKYLKSHMELYRDAGGKSVTVSLMHKPWNGQTYDYFESMVTWMKKVDGSWWFDFSVFDKWVQFMFDLGIDKQINCYSMVPWKLSFQYFDQASNSFKFITTKPGEKAYEEVWTAMLGAFAKHLKEKGWFEKTMISMDERPMKVMLETKKVIEKADPNFKISLAGALHKELVRDLDDYCVALRMKYDPEDLAQRKAEGKVTTFYTSCEEPHPNTFTFADPADSEWFGWYAAKAQLDGYLRWALNSWVIEPLLDSRFYTWAAGDTYLIYPGARTSIRFERMTAGVQAWEKIRILKEEYQAKGNKGAVKRIEKALQLFDENKLDEMSSAEMIKKAKSKLTGLGF